MEHRVRFRDIPWPMAIAVLPGKIIGTFIIKPILWFKDDPLNAILRCCVSVMITLLVIGSVSVFDGVVLEEKLGVAKGVKYILGDWKEYEEAKAARLREEMERAVLEAKKQKTEDTKNARAAECRIRDAIGRCR